MGYLGSDDDEDGNGRKASSKKPKNHEKIARLPTAEQFDISTLDGTEDDGCHIDGDNGSNHFQGSTNSIEWVDAAIDSVFGNLEVASRASAGTQTQTESEISLETALLKVEFLEAKVCSLYEILAEFEARQHTSAISEQAIKEKTSSASSGPKPVPIYEILAQALAEQPIKEKASKLTSASASAPTEAEKDSEFEAVVASYAQLSPLIDSLVQTLEAEALENP